MPTLRLELRSPNTSIPNMRPRTESDDDDAGSYFSGSLPGSPYYDYDGGKKRPASEDQNPVGTKKSKTDREGNNTKSSALPQTMVLNMNKDPNFNGVMQNVFKEIERGNKNVNGMVKDILKNLQQFILLDTNHQPVNNDIASQKIKGCIQDRLRREKRKSGEIRVSTQQSIILNRQVDQNYATIMNKCYQQALLKGNVNLDKIAVEAFDMLKQNYHVLDRNKNEMDDEAVLKTLKICLTNLSQQHAREKKRNKNPQQSNVTVTSVATTSSAPASIILDMNDNIYRDVMNKYVDDRNRKEYSVSEAGKAILQELQTMLSTDGKFLKKVSQDRYVGVDSESALQMIINTLTEKSLDLSAVNLVSSLPLGKSRAQQQGASVLVNRSPKQGKSSEQVLTKDNLSEADRVGLLEYFGGSIVTDYLKLVSCGWEFRRKSGLVGDVWIATKKGVTENDAVEGVTMLTGERNIANWAFLEGHFKAYANTEFGRGMLEKKGLSVKSYQFIFDEDKSDESQGMHAQDFGTRSNSNPAGFNASENHQVACAPKEVQEPGATGVSKISEGASEDELLEKSAQSQVVRVQNAGFEPTFKVEDVAGVIRFCKTASNIKSSIASAEKEGNNHRIEFFEHLNQWLEQKSTNTAFVDQFRGDHIVEAVSTFDAIIETMKSVPESTQIYKNAVGAFLRKVRQGSFGAGSINTVAYFNSLLQ